jgi:PAS domain S-box-containing protein
VPQCDKDKANGGFSFALHERIKIEMELLLHLPFIMPEARLTNEILARHPLHRIIEEIKDFAIFLVDAQARIISWNEGARRVFGFEESEVKGRNVSLLYTPEDLAFGVPEHELETARREGRSETTRWHRRKDGSRFFSNGVTLALFNDDGSVQGYAKVARDETPRRLAEDELQDARIRLEAAVAAGNVGTWIWDIQSDRVLADASLATLLGVPFERKGAPLDDYIRAIHPNDRARVQADIEKALDARGFYVTEYRVAPSDGPVRWLEARGQVQVDENGEPSLLPGVVFDITPRKAAEEAALESERQFAVLADSIPQLAWMTDATGWIFWYNRRWYDYTGTTFDEMQGWGWQKVHHPDEVERVTERFKQFLISGEAWEDTFPLRGRDGKFRWFLSRAMPIRDAEGRVVRWFGTNTDIEEWRLAREAAEQANRIKDEFLATLSHELRTPLNAILGWANLLRSNTLDSATTAQGLETIERNARLQSKLIEDILDVSRIMSGKIALDLQQVELAHVVEAALDSVRPTAGARDISLTLELSPEPGLIKGDAARLQQIIWNLLSNAIKFTPRGGSVRVALGRVESLVQVTVSDSGQGIAPEFLPHVFDRFRQADSSSTRQHSGLGLGLSIVRQLVELHGGTVWAESEGIGHGATFCVQFPLAAVALPAHESTSEVAPVAPQKSAEPIAVPQRECVQQLTGLRVLVVDDEADARSLIRTVLEGCGAMVRTAASAPEAMALFTQSDFNFLVSDIGMPGEDGYTLLTRLREFCAAQGRTLPPAIALTAFARSEDRIRALRTGFAMHVPKPVEPAELIAVVASVAATR